MKYLFAIIITIVLLYFSFLGGSWLDSKIYWPKHEFYYYKHEPEKISFESDGLTLSGYFYSPEADSVPVVIIVHGLTSQGKDFDLYEIIANELVEKNYAVFAIDMRGFNESEDPDTIRTYEDFNLANDVYAAIEKVKEFENVDTSRIFLLGHSMGAGVVLAAVNPPRSNEIKAVISIEPDRGGREIDTVSFSNRLTKDLKLDYVFKPSVTEVLEKRTNTYYVLEEMKEHPPILFFDTEEAGRHDKMLQDFQKLSEPKEITIVPNTYHYFGTKYGENWGKKRNLLSFYSEVPGSPDAVINVKAIKFLINEITKFLNDPQNYKGKRL